MKNQFIPYELALKLKKLGFNEECLKCHFPNPNKNLGEQFDLVTTDKYLPKQIQTIGNLIKDGIFTNCVLAPLWQQAFDWFRDRKYSNHIEFDNELNYYNYALVFDMEGYMFGEGKE